jgi:Holliday junction resolvasome RuvABC endonuclease subunit
MNQNKEKDPLTRYDVLGLDIATHTGYFSMHESGVWDFTESMRRNSNKQHGAFRKTLIEFITRHNIKVIVAEDVSVNKHFTDARKLSELRGILMEICDTLDLPEPIFINPKTVKKWATGDGNATKEMMVKYCKIRWKTNPVDDNEADATHIFMYYVKKFKL